MTLTALDHSPGGEVWTRATTRGKACPGQAYQGGPETGENGAIVWCLYTFQRASGSLEKATAPGSWHMPRHWHGCPPGTSGGSAPAQQRKQGWGLDYQGTSQKLRSRKPLNAGHRRMEGLLSPSPPQEERPLCIKVIADLKRGKKQASWRL